MKPLQALLFDLDDTLLDGSHFSGAVKRTAIEVAQSAGDIDPDELVSANSLAFVDHVQEQGLTRWELGEISGKETSYAIWRGALARLGLHDAVLLERLCEVQHKYAQESYKPFDDVPRALQYFDSLGLALGIVTNGAQDSQLHKLESMKLSHYFSTIVMSGDLGIVKPDAAIFEAALRRLQIDAENVWHVGDNLKTDVAGANGAYITSVWLNRGGSSNETGIKPSFEVGSLLELEALVRSNLSERVVDQ